MPRDASGLPRRLQVASTVAAATTVAVGLLVLMGWAFDVEPLKGPIPGLITMKANTALAFVLGGVSLWLLQRPRTSRAKSRAARAYALLAALIGAVSLAQYVFGWSAGIDELLFDDSPSAARTVDPGRLAPQTALSFTLIGVALLTLDRRWASRRRLVEVLGVPPVLLSVFALLGYVYGVDRLSTVGAVSPMALHTALTTLVLSLGLLCARPDGALLSVLASPSSGGILARRLLPAAIVGVPALGYVRLKGEHAGLYGPEVGTALFALALMIVFGALIIATARALNRGDAARREAEVVQRQLAAIVESSNDAILGTTLDGVVTSWNLGAQKLYGYAADEIIGRPISTLVPPSSRGEDERILGAVITGDRIDNHESTLAKQNGDLVEVALTVSPIKGPDGTVVGASTIARDITERRRAAEALEEATCDADRANRAKSEFLSRMSHELRTPLNAVLGFGQLLEMDELDARQRQNVSQILAGGRHLLGLINEVLEISRIEAGKIALSMEAVHAGGVIGETVNLMQPMAAERDIRILTGGEPCDRHVRADNQKLKQVLLNLLSNAIKYNREAGTVTVSCEEGPADRLRLRVTDTGMGIAPEQLDKLFVPFERLGAERGTVEGTGLGLALSKRLVEMMGGTLSVRSEPGGGTSFTVELALAASPLQATVAVADGEVALAAGSRARASSLLYIEDNLSNFKLVEQILDQRSQATLLTAMDGRLGLELAQQHSPDLILLDLHLPGMSGEEVLGHLKADLRTRQIPVVVVSADATESQVERLLASGALAYLTKPLDVERFLEAVEESLGSAAPELSSAAAWRAAP